jgi:hypothetical protein
MSRAMVRGRPRAPTNLRIIGAGFGLPPNSQPAPDVNRSVRLLVTVNRDTHAVQALTSNDITGPVYEESARFGDYLYEVRERGTTIATGTIVGDPFEKRSLKTREPHETTRGGTATFVVTIPFVTKSALRSRAIDVVFYRFKNPREQEVTVESIARLKTEQAIEQVASLNASEIQKTLR